MIRTKVASMVEATFARLLALAREERAQVGFEYMLTIGAWAVAFAAAFLLLFEGVVPAILETVCGAVDPLGDGNCIG
jgi:hypothetical protein